MEKVLVVEDSKTINNLVSNKLSSLGFDVHSAYTLSEADKLLSNNRYEFIILDLHLPDGEGIDLINSIRSITKSKIVILTSLKDKYVREELFRFGILDYIIKDVNLHYSLEELVKIIKRQKQIKGEKILVIDDSKFVCNQIKRILEPRDYVVQEVYSGKEALNVLDNIEGFSLIVLDMTLPDMSGLELLEKIRADDEITPIIVLSGTADEDTVRNILKNGANEYIKKPFIYEEFILKVDLWIDYYKKEKQLVEKNRQIEELNRNLEKRVKEEVEKNLEKDRMLFAQARLAQMGEILNIIAHQWKQPLNSLSLAIGRTYYKLRKEKKLDEDVLDFCYENVKLQLEEMSNTIKNFMDFFKPNKKKEVFNLYQNLRKALRILKGTFDKENIKMEINVDKDIEIEGYKNEFNQVILNILSNAKDAFIERGIENRKVRIYSDFQGDFLNLFIEDNARGIPENIINRIFEPYFSTKSNVGTGLGLYISKLIIEKYMNGKLTVENTEKGAKFKISIPVLNRKQRVTVANM